jgi:CRISPR-associated endonuclease/helicase Cas3
MDLAHAQDCDRDALADAVQAVLEYEPAEDGAPPAPPQWWKEILRGLQSRPPERHPAGGVILFGSRATGSRRSEEADLFADDDDLTSASGREVSLDEHCDLVERTAVKLADRCLTPAHVEIVRLAAHWHDTGKLDERFQVLLRHGDVLAALSGEAPLAKSAFIPASPARRRQIRDAAGIPTDFRHEMLSVQLAERHALLPPDAEARDLFLHLVASHHGHARPFAPVCLDDNPPAVSGERGGTAIALSGAERAALPPAHRLDSGISERFWRLVRRHGWWGLVYLEAILRLSDWYASELAVQPREPVREEATA